MNEDQAARPVEGGLREALQEIIDLPTVVPDHAHGGIHPPYLEWVRVAAIARAALAKTPETTPWAADDDGDHSAFTHGDDAP